MSELITLINYIAVSIFGSILSAAFCGIGKEKKQRNLIVFTVGVALIIEGIVYYFYGERVVHEFYPIFAHIPLVIVLWVITKRFLSSLSSVLTAYLCCQFRRWLALLFTFAFKNSDGLLQIVQIIITVPFLILLLKYVVASVREMIMRPAAEMWTFAIVPIVYYLFDYSTVVYTKLLYEGSYIVAEFMPTFSCLFFLIYVKQSTKQEKTRYRLEQEKNAFEMQAKQSVKEIDFLRKSQEQAAAHRHDLRHHMQYIASCIANNQNKQALEYINSVCKEIEAQKVIDYCQNETANLILTAYAQRFEKSGISCEIKFVLGRDIRISSVDMCIILANALENALNECKFLMTQNISTEISVNGYEKDNRIFIQISNTCRQNVLFNDGMPVTKAEGHGVGTKSICSVVNKYKGMCSFNTKGDMFILRVVI